LFRSEQKTRNKTNLMVFLRPVIINDRGTAQAVTSNRYDYIQGVQGAYKQDNNLMKDNDDPVVPPMPIGPSQGGSPAMNLFDLDKMRRQQMAPPPANAGPATAGPAPATNGTVQTNPVTVAPSTQSSPATVAPSTASPGVRP
jgi:general secretion pathway protein D